MDAYPRLGVEADADTYNALMEVRCAELGWPASQGADAVSGAMLRHPRMRLTGQKASPPACNPATRLQTNTRRLSPSCLCTCVVQGCLASGRVETAMDVHGTMVGAGQQGNSRTHELMVQAGIVSGAPFLRAVLPPFRAARNMRAAMSGTQLASLVALVLLLKPCVVAATGDVEVMMTALQDMEAAGYSPKARLLERCVARCAVQRAALCCAVLPVKRNGWWLHALQLKPMIPPGLPGCRAERAGDRDALRHLLKQLFAQDYRIVGVDAKVGRRAVLCCACCAALRHAVCIQCGAARCHAVPWCAAMFSPSLPGR